MKNIKNRRKENNDIFSESEVTYLPQIPKNNFEFQKKEFEVKEENKEVKEDKKEEKHRLRKNGKNVVNEYKKELDDLLEENYDGEEDLNQQ